MPDQEKVRVNIKRDFSLRGPNGVETYYPGVQDVPPHVARMLELSPEFVQTDGAGIPLPHTVAASALGYSTSARPAVGNAVPAPDTSEAYGEEFDTEPGSDPRSGVSQAVIDAREDREGEGLRGEEGGTLTEEPERQFAQVGQREESEEEARRREIQERENLRRHAIANGENPDEVGGEDEETGDGDGSSQEGEPMTKSEIRAHDVGVLEAYARENNIRVKSTGTRGATKEDYVEAIHRKGVTRL